MSVSPPFHLAFAVTDIGATRAFYVEKLGCKVGRSAERWIDFDFFGHQVQQQHADRANILEAGSAVGHAEDILLLQDVKSGQIVRNVQGQCFSPSRLIQPKKNLLRLPLK